MVNQKYIKIIEVNVNVKIWIDLNWVCVFPQDYLAYIIEHSGLLIRPEQVCFLFGNIEDIYEFNR